MMATQNDQLRNMMENYKNTLRTVTGYTQDVDVDKMDLSKASSLLSDLEDRLGSLPKNEYASRITTIAQHMGMKKVWVDEYMRTQYNDQTTFCLPHVLNATILSYAGKLDRVA